MAISGSIRKLALGGIDFDVAGDVNVSKILSKFENASVPTSGDNLRKMTKRAQVFDGVAIICDTAQADTLKGFADNLDDITMNLTLASGAKYKSVGFIEFATHETEELRGSVQLHPRADWTPIVV